MSSVSRSGTDSLRIIAQGCVVRFPLGGMVWSDLHYLMGLSRLGHDVYFIEDSEEYESCYDPENESMSREATYGLKFAHRVFDRIGFGERWAFYNAHRSEWQGPAANRMPGICESADLLLNLAGANPPRPWFDKIPARAFVDQDPAFTQVRILRDPERKKRAGAHNLFFSFGENLERGCARIPSTGSDWQATRQPIVIEELPLAPPSPRGKITTVMQWGSYRPAEHDGVRYGLKADSFPPYLEIPERCGESFELVFAGKKSPRRLLRDHGWSLREPLEATRDPQTYEDFIRDSKAEFGIAKHGYVVSNSGWFSERSCCYLASGRPVLAQETGFSTWLNPGEGVLPFSDPGEALAAIEDLNRRYEAHCRAARELAFEYFDYRKVLPHLLGKCAAAESAS